MSVSRDVALFWNRCTEDWTELSRLIEDYRRTEKEVETLSGLLPICAHGKNVRDDRGYWLKLESYISERSSAEFSHGICPDCMRKYYPDICNPDICTEKPEKR